MDYLFKYTIQTNIPRVSKTKNKKLKQKNSMKLVEIN